MKAHYETREDKLERALHSCKKHLKEEINARDEMVRNEKRLRNKILEKERRQQKELIRHEERLRDDIVKLAEKKLREEREKAGINIEVIEELAGVTPRGLSGSSRSPASRYKEDLLEAIKRLQETSMAVGGGRSGRSGRGRGRGERGEDGATKNVTFGVQEQNRV